MIANNKTEDSFSGDGVRFTVFKFTEETNFFTNLQIYNPDNIDDEISKALSYLSLSTEEKFYLNFNEPYLSYQITQGNRNQNSLTILFYPHKKMCVFIEEII